MLLPAMTLVEYPWLVRSSPYTSQAGVRLRGKPSGSVRYVGKRHAEQDDPKHPQVCV